MRTKLYRNIERLNYKEILEIIYKDVSEQYKQGKKLCEWGFEFPLDMKLKGIIDSYKFLNNDKSLMVTFKDDYTFKQFLEKRVESIEENISLISKEVKKYSKDVDDTIFIDSYSKKLLNLLSNAKEEIYKIENEIE